MTINQIRADQAAAMTDDAHSYDRYGAQEWRAAAQALFNLGLSDRGVQAVLRSKWMRWAADRANRSVTGAEAVDIVRYVAKEYPTKTARDAAVKRLIAETFD